MDNDSYQRYGKLLYDAFDLWVNSNPYNKQVNPESLMVQFLSSGYIQRYLNDKHTPDFYRI